MKYTVIIMPEAQANIVDAFEYIARRWPINAGKWLRGLNKQIDSLETFPARCGFAREQDHFVEEIRQLVFKSHRIIFTIDNPSKTVRVVYVRHTSMRAIGE